MAVTILETIKSAANAGNTAYIVILQLLCDTAADLPTQYSLAGYELAQGCKAHVIDTNEDYMLDSSGAWHISGGEIWQNVYTKTETDTLLAGKQDTLTTAQLDAVDSGITAAKVHQYDDTVTDEAEDRAAIVELVDGGAKNFVQLGFTSTSGSSSVPATTNNNDGTITVNGSRVGAATILVQDLITAKTSSVNTRYTLPAGNYVIAPTGNANIGLQVYKHDGTNLVGLGNARTGALSFTYSDTDKVQYPYICIRLFCEGNVTINNFTFMPMVCTQASWDISQAYQPYRPSWQEMYEMILALQ